MSGEEVELYPEVVCLACSHKQSLLRSLLRVPAALCPSALLMQVLPTACEADAYKSERNLMRTGEGVCVQASTLGSLEALLEFLRSQKEPIPVSSIAIGPIHRKDVMRAKVMLEKVPPLCCNHHAASVLDSQSSFHQ